jgi:replicative DNA helicase
MAYIEGCGSLEQDAGVILHLHQPPNTNRHKVYITKNRDGIKDIVFSVDFDLASGAINGVQKIKE